MLAFLAVNGIDLLYDHGDLIDIIEKIASGENNQENLQDWLQQHTEKSSG